MSGGIKTSITTYREIWLLGTKHTSFKVYQIEFFFAILLNLLLTWAEKETFKTVKAVTAISSSLQDSWIQQYSIRYLVKNYPRMGTCEEPLQLITLKQSESFGLFSMTICSYKHSFFSSLILGWKKTFKVNTAAPPFPTSLVSCFLVVLLFSVPQAYVPIK